LKRIKPSLIPAAGWFIISAILFTLPGSALPKENWLDKIWFDKWVHIGIFTILVALWCRGWHSIEKDVITKKLRKIFITIGIICLIYGIAVEFVQRYFVSNRSFVFADIIADAMGCATGVIFSIRRYIKK
jgi:vacuolar-type H+-ATPase subunit I/STV1